MSALLLEQQSLLCSQVAFAELTASYEIILELDLNLHLSYSWQQNPSSKAVSGQFLYLPSSLDKFKVDASMSNTTVM